MASKKKKIIATKKNNEEAVSAKLKSSTEKNRRRSRDSEAVLIFNKENYKWVIIGVIFITLGMLLMLGGFNVDPNVFDEAELYSFRRTLIAPVFILTGLAIEIYAIFK